MFWRAVPGALELSVLAGDTVEFKCFGRTLRAQLAEGGSWQAGGAAHRREAWTMLTGAVHMQTGEMRLYADAQLLTSAVPEAGPVRVLVEPFLLVAPRERRAEGQLRSPYRGALGAVTASASFVDPADLLLALHTSTASAGGDSSPFGYNGSISSSCGPFMVPPPPQLGVLCVCDVCM